MADDPDQNRRLRRLVAVGAAVIILLVGVPLGAGIYINVNWFHSVGRYDVYSTILQTQWLLGLGVAILFALLLELNAQLATRLSTGLPTLRVNDPNLAQLDLGQVAPRVLRLIGPLAGLFAGLAAANQWSAWLRFTHASQFGHTDPIFGRDVGFYVFTLPVLEAAETLGMWIVGLSFVLSVAIYVVRGAVVWTGRLPDIDRRARIHLGVLVILLFALLGLGTWLESLNLLYSDQGPVAGASYTDVNARLPALRLQIATAALGAILVAASLVRWRPVLVIAAAALYLGVEILGVRVYPATVQQFSVEPNEASKEAPYIEHNMEATRIAYGLDDVTERKLSADAELDQRDIEENQGTIENIRVWDYQQLLDTFAQIQEIRTYYDFTSVDNDRYMIDGELRQVMLSPRELAAESLPNRTWINERFTFTHGYGLTLGPVNRATEEGLPFLYLKDIPPKSTVDELEVTQPRIYFGELSNHHVFVHTNNPEFDRPAGGKNLYKPYQGKAGMELDSLWMRLALALDFGSFKILLSNDITDKSRVLMRRKVQDRVQHIAPFLELDHDPYMVVRDNGRLVWVQDAYTTTSRYPYAEPARQRLNYIRNSVKVVVDAYDGTAQFYIADSEDPVLRTWRRTFPGMFRSLDKMPDDIRRHLRHPEELFRIQTRMFSTYHMDRPKLIYSREDLWAIPQINRNNNVHPVQPYYTTMRLPGEEEAEFIFMLPYTPKRKKNMAAWMVARNDGEHLGELMVYRFPRDRLVFGPQQIVNRINQDTEISRQVSLWDQRGSNAIFGQLLVIPIEESLIYVSPLYLRSQGGQIPELKRVIVAYGDRIAMEPTLDDALRALFGEGPEDGGAKKKPRPDGREPKGQAPDGQPDEEAAAGEQALSAAELAARAAAQESKEERLSGDPRVRAKQLFERAVGAQRQGNWAEYGSHLEELKQVLRTLAEQADQQPAD